MSIQRLEHIGVVVDDLAAAIEFFVALGLQVEGEAMVEGGWVDRIVGLEGVRSEIVMLVTADGHGRLELTKFHSPAGAEPGPAAPANAMGLRHVSFRVDDVEAAVSGLRARGVELVGELVQYSNSYKLCYVRGPEGIIVELAQAIGSDA
jgi:catechol 2,3-dioxygenase-like lactoylglutathione lyase family enzyme